MPVHIPTRTACLLVAAGLLTACSDKQATSGISDAIDRTKVAFIGDRLPEQDSDAAIRNHGLSTLQQWANDGDKKAQHFIAVAYLTGSAVPKNQQEAVMWARRAANQGVPASQYLMGVLRRDEALGENLLTMEPNLLLSYMWFSLAAAQGHSVARGERDKLEVALGAKLVHRAQLLATNWRSCSTSSCIDLEPDPGPPSFCGAVPKPIVCP